MSREGPLLLPWGDLPVPESCAHKPFALLEEEGGGVRHTLQGLSHSSHNDAHEVSSAVAQQVVDGWLAHRTHP